MEDGVLLVREGVAVEVDIVLIEAAIVRHAIGIHRLEI